MSREYKVAASNLKVYLQDCFKYRDLPEFSAVKIILRRHLQKDILVEIPVTMQDDKALFDLVDAKLPMEVFEEIDFYAFAPPEVKDYEKSEGVSPQWACPAGTPEGAIAAMKWWKDQPAWRRQHDAYTLWIHWGRGWMNAGNNPNAWATSGLLRKAMDELRISYYVRS